MTYGYARVSSRDQNEARQLDALHAAGVETVYIDKQSGKDFNRPQYKRLLRRLKRDDLLYIKSIDRLGRNYDEIIEQWRALTKDRGVDMVVLDMPLLDTRQSGRDLTGTFVADLVLQILSYVAQAERENIRQRQQEGIAAARLRGVRCGRPRKQVPAEFEWVRQQWEQGRITSRQAARQLGVAQDTFLRWAHGK